jgi:hypothetical protein
MASPLVGIAAVNSLLFAAYGQLKRLVDPFGDDLTLGQTALVGAGAGGINAILASPVGVACRMPSEINSLRGTIMLVLGRTRKDQDAGELDILAYNSGATLISILSPCRVR